MSHDVYDRVYNVPAIFAAATTAVTLIGFSVAYATVKGITRLVKR
jgi:hypothetical protein